MSNYCSSGSWSWSSD